MKIDKTGRLVGVDWDWVDRNVIGGRSAKYIFQQTDGAIWVSSCEPKFSFGGLEPERWGVGCWSYPLVGLLKVKRTELPSGLWVVRNSFGRWRVYTKKPIILFGETFGGRPLNIFPKQTWAGRLFKRGER